MLLRLWRPRLSWWLVLRRTIIRLRPRLRFVLSRRLGRARVLRRLARLHGAIRRWLCDRRTIISRRRFRWVIHFRPIRFGPIRRWRIRFRTVVRFGGRMIIPPRRLRTIRRWTIRRLIGSGLVRLRTIRRRSCPGPLVRIRIHRPIRRRVPRLISGTRHVSCRSRRRRPPRRRLLYHRLIRRRRRRSKALHLLASHRLAGMCGECLLFCSKRNRRWRRSGFGDHRTCECRARRGCYMIRRAALMSHNGCLSRCNRHSCGDGRSSDLLASHRYGRVRHWLSAGKGLLRHSRDCAVDVPVRVGHVGDGRSFVDDGGVVDVGDGGLIDRCVADVDAIHVGRTDSVRRHVHFTRSQRKPRHIATASWSTTHKYDQRRSIHGPNLSWARDPTPTARHKRPPAIVKWGVAPRLVIDPSPSPGIDPRPMSIMVGCPARINARVPHIAVLRVGLPIAVVIEILGADNIGRDVA